MTAVLTTEEAANFLNLSHSHLAKLLETGQIPFQLAGEDQMVLKVDLLRYRENLKEIRRKGLEFLAKEAQDLKLGY